MAIGLVLNTAVFITGLVIVVTDAYTFEGMTGIQMTSAAFESVFPWFKYVLSLTAVLFAFAFRLTTRSAPPLPPVNDPMVVPAKVTLLPATLIWPGPVP